MNPQLLLQLQVSLTHTNFVREEDLVAYLLEWFESVPDVDSAGFYFILGKQDFLQQMWRKLDGTATLGDEESYSQSLWLSLIQGQRTWRESLSQNDLTIPAPSEGMQDRCFIPIHGGDDQMVGFFVLQSGREKAFSLWEIDMIELFASICGTRLQQRKEVLELKNQLTALEQRESFEPPVLDGFIQLARSLLAENASYLAICQHNLDVVQDYSRKLLDLIPFFLDEIRIHVEQEGVQRVQDKAKRSGLEDIELDIDLLLSDLNDSLSKIRLFFQDLVQLRQRSSAHQSFDLIDLLSSQVALIFSSHATRIETTWEKENHAPFYGDKAQIRRAFVLLLLAIQRELSQDDEDSELFLSSYETSEHLCLSMQFRNYDDQQYSLEMEGRPYIERVLDAHQASYQIRREEEETIVTVYFPVLFQDDVDSGVQETLQEGMSFFALPALGENFSFPSGSSESISEAEPEEVDSFRSLKLLVVSEDTLFLRAIRRVLSPQHQVLATTEREKALALLDAHQDVDLVVCDLQDQAKTVLSLINHLEDNSPAVAKKCCYLFGLRLGKEALSFMQKVKTRCIHRDALYQELSQFLNEQAQLASL